MPWVHEFEKLSNKAKNAGNKEEIEFSKSEEPLAKNSQDLFEGLFYINLPSTCNALSATTQSLNHLVWQYLQKSNFSTGKSNTLLPDNSYNA